MLGARGKAACAVVAVMVVAGAAPGATKPDTPCFGAAARDPHRPCENPTLRHSVVPGPLEAKRLPGAPCASKAREGRVSVCEFGVPAAGATRTVALVGDSHAAHWRAAMDELARAHGWRGLSISHSSCPLQKALRAIPMPGRRASCIRWKRAVFRWFDRHPEVSMVFVAGLTSGTGVVPSHGRSQFATSVDSYIDAWRALPPTVERIVVIRDTPKVRGDVNDCVHRVMQRGARADLVCALPRSQALDRDPAAVAAGRLHTPRVRAVDLTRFFCDRRRCYPVIGGALVCRDQNHLTAVYSATLGPYLLREVDEALA